MKKLKVSFFNEQTAYKITPELKKLIKECCKQTLYLTDNNYNSEISVSFVDNEQIREINREYRNIDRATDVLSFPLADNCEFDYNPDSDCYALGDIIISCERAIEQAVEIGNTTEREIAFLVIHSMLHILGYDHPDEESPMTKDMREMQNKVIEKLGI